MKKRLNLQLDESDIIMIKTVAAQEGLLPGRLIVKAVEEYKKKYPDPNPESKEEE